TDTSASAACIAAMNASQPGRKSLASALVVLASGNRATHCAPLSSFWEAGMMTPLTAIKARQPPSLSHPQRSRHANSSSLAAARARYATHEERHNPGVVSVLFREEFHHARTGIQGWADIAGDRRFEQCAAGDGPGGAEAEGLPRLFDRTHGHGHGRASLA